MKKKLLAVAAAVATLPAAYAVDFKAGNWDMSVGGNVNAFYTGVNCTGGAVTGGLADKAAACGGKENATTIGNGLLPSQLNVGAKTNQDGFDVAAVVGISVATATSSSIGQNKEVDVRNAYMTFGNKDMGTFKLGRDYGLFGLNPVLNDMTLLGVGAAYKATQNGRVSLGHIGAGYTYAGTYGQMAYTSPTFGNGMTVDFGLMNPVDSANTVNVSGSGPATQARLTYANQGFKAWVAQKNQSFDTFNMSATEVGASLTSGRFGLLANYQSGTGLGILSDADQGNVKGKNTFVQVTYKLADKVKVGVGSGKSENDTGTAFRSNQSTTAGVYYNLTSSLTLVGEVGDTTSKTFANTADAKQKSYTFGGIFFF